jgi:hypothetical protein
MKTKPRWSARSVRGAMIAGGLALMPGSQAVAAESAVSPWSRLAAGNTQVTCLGSNQTLYSPPVTSTPQGGSMTHASRYSCLSVFGASVSSATVAATTVDYLGYTCDEVLGSGPESFTVVWRNGESSELLLAPAEVDVQATTTTVTYSGEVVGGKFKGVEAVRSWTFLNSDLTSRCASSAGLPETNVFAILVLSNLPSLPR